MYVICSEERFVEISSPNECDKILKIPNKQTEPTDYTANCSKDYIYPGCMSYVVKNVLWKFHRRTNAIRY